MEFDRAKFLLDVSRWEERNAAIRARQSQIVDIGRSLRGNRERLARLQEDRAGLRNHRQETEMRAAYDQQIAALQHEIESTEAWFRELEALQSDAQARNQPLGQLIASMREILARHRAPDPSLKVWA